MPEFTKLKISEASLGLVTDRDSADQPLGSASVATNLTFESKGFWKKTRGPKTATLNSAAVPDLPSGFTPERGIVYRVRRPSQKDVVVLFGSEDGRDRLYMTPWYDPVSAAWDQTGWEELTEIISCKANTVTSPEVFTVDGNANLSATDDYYNKWYVQAWDRSAGRLLGWDVVLDYTGSTNTITTKYGLGQLAADDDVVLCKFPVFLSMNSTVGSGNYDVDDLLHYRFDSTPDFQVFGEDLYIYTGSQHDMATGPDLWLGFIDQNAYFGDTDLAYTGYHLDHAHPFKAMRAANQNTERYWYGTADEFDLNSGATDSLPYETDVIDGYAFIVTLLADGFQESNTELLDAGVWSTPVFKTMSGTDETIDVYLKTNPVRCYNRVSEWNDLPANANEVLSRRITKVVIYATQGLRETGYIRPTNGTIYNVKELDINDSNWTETTPSDWAATTAYSLSGRAKPTSANRNGFHYVVSAAGTSGGSEPTWPTTIGNTVVDGTVTWVCTGSETYYAYDNLNIAGREWEEGQLKDSGSVKGYFSQNIGANADFATRISGNYAVGPFYADQEYRDAFLVAPFTGAFGGGRVTPAVLPVAVGKFSFFTREQGVNKIVAITDFQGMMIIFGENSFVRAVLDGQNSEFREHPSQRGLVSKYGFQVIDNILYFCSHESIYAFDGSQIVDIGERIRSSWRDGITDANKSTAIMGYNIRKKLLLVQAGTTLFSYDTLRNYWATETVDHSTNTSWIQFLNTPDNKLFVIATDKLWELDADSFTGSRSTTWRSNAISQETELDIRRLYLAYQSDEIITINIYDGNLSTTQPVETAYLPPNSKQEEYELPVSVRAERVFIEAITPSSTNSGYKLGKLALGVIPKGKD